MKIPILISIPHGGTVIPEEVKGLTVLNRKQLLEDIDACTQQIYTIDACALVLQPYARTFVDVNRDPDDLPPLNRDGAVKTHTANLEPIYRDSDIPGRELIEHLVDRYHRPFHQRIAEMLQSDSIKLALDCHSMSSLAPPISRYHGEARPTVCLGNVQGRAASHEMVSMLAACFREVFNLPPGEVTINRPFSGGYITRQYGNNPIPWIQVEINKKLYFAEPWLDPETVVNPGRLKELNSFFRKTVTLFLERLP
jgi:N-formylglutamate deformylase